MNYPALARAKLEIDEGKLGIAKDRLHGLVLSYPCDLSLRSHLADVYMRLGYPREAGRWWFFEEDLSLEQQEAVQMFIRECKEDPAEIIRRLKLRCAPEQLPSKASQERIQQQIDECVRRGLPVPTFKHPPAPRSTSWSERWFTVGCTLVILLFLFLISMGIAMAHLIK